MLISKPGGTRYFLGRDAAAVLILSSSHGVLKAFMSGLMTTAHSIAQFENVEQKRKLEFLDTENESAIGLSKMWKS